MVNCTLHCKKCLGDTTGVIISRKSKKCWYYNCEQKKKKKKRAKNGREYTAQNTKGGITRTPHKSEDEPKC